MLRRTREWRMLRWSMSMRQVRTSRRQTDRAGSLAAETTLEQRDRRLERTLLTHCFHLSSLVCVFVGVESRFRRTVNSSAVSTFSVSGRKMAFGQYKEQLEAIGLWIEAKNFLVFQVRCAHT